MIRIFIPLLIPYAGLEFVTQLIVEDEDRAAAILSMTKECVIGHKAHHSVAHQTTYPSDHSHCALYRPSLSISKRKCILPIHQSRYKFA